ncbi:hypothetical protein ACNOYE_12235 [Nannocystaceae bacterium ST9]
MAELALRGLSTNLSDPHAADYYWMVAACLPFPMREELLMSMQDSYFTESERSLPIYKRAAAEGREEGRQEGREAGREEARKALIQAILTSLRNRGLESSPELAAQLEQIHDHERLIAVVVRAAVIESSAALLAELLAPA